MLYTITNKNLIRAICPMGGASLTVECRRDDRTMGKVTVDNILAVSVGPDWIKDFRAVCRSLTEEKPVYTKLGRLKREEKWKACEAKRIDASRPKIALPVSAWARMIG